MHSELRAKRYPNMTLPQKVIILQGGWVCQSLVEVSLMEGLALHYGFCFTVYYSHNEGQDFLLIATDVGPQS